MRRKRYETNFDRAAGTLLVGSTVGSIFMALAFLVAFDGGFAVSLGGAIHLSLYTRLMRLPGAVLVFIPFYVVGLSVVGAPGWFVLHSLKLRGWLSAFIFGFVALLLVLEIIFPDMKHRPFWQMALLAFGGGLTGLTIWRVAYRRTANRQQAPFF